MLFSARSIASIDVFKTVSKNTSKNIYSANFSEHSLNYDRYKRFIINKTHVSHGV